MSYKIKSDLSEKQIEADVAMYLGWCSAGLPFRLIDVDEQLTGADKLSDIAVPIYIQFKKSLGLKPLKEPVPKLRSNESKLQQVRRFRREHGLADDPTLYFQLRKKAENATDLQHNVLLKLQRPDLSYAIYVAPTCLDKSKYYDELTKGPRYLSDPWKMHPWELHSDFTRIAWLSRYDLQPFLRNHVSITPHERVGSHEHYYAYSSAGDEISWHSPELVEGGVSRLSDFMSMRVRELLLGEAVPDPSESLALARDTMSQFDISTQDMALGETPFENLRNYGRWLKKAMGIRQILLCSNRRDLSEAREYLHKF